MSGKKSACLPIIVFLVLGVSACGGFLAWMRTQLFGKTEPRETIPVRPPENDSKRGNSLRSPVEHGYGQSITVTHAAAPRAADSPDPTAVDGPSPAALPLPDISRKEQTFTLA